MEGRNVSVSLNSYLKQVKGVSFHFIIIFRHDAYKEILQGQLVDQGVTSSNCQTRP